MITEEQIWDYLDGNVSDTARAAITKAIDNDADTAQLFKEISALHTGIKQQQLLSPAVSFTNSIMASIAHEGVYVPAKAISFKTLLLFVLPTLAVIIVFAGLLIKQNIPFTLSMPVLDLSRFKLIFILVDILLLLYVIDSMPGKKMEDVSTAPAQQ